MKYYVKSIDGMKFLAGKNGVSEFDTIAEAKMSGVDAGSSFVVVERDNSFRSVLFGVDTGMGFFFLDGTLQNRDTSWEPGVVSEMLIGTDQRISVSSVR